MSKAIYCDKCHKLFPEGKIESITVDGMYTETGEFDLCTKCKDKLSDFLEW